MAMSEIGERLKLLTFVHGSDKRVPKKMESVWISEKERDLLVTLLDAWGNRRTVLSHAGDPALELKKHPRRAVRR
jgi:hypothetical protein